MAANCSSLSDTQCAMLKHIVLDISTDFNVARPSHCCIYKVPPNLRDVNKDAYTPQLIAIGPLHRENESLAPMETEKYRYFQFFWNRPNAQELLEGYKSKLQKQEERIRSSYAVKLPNECCKEKLVEMILLDAVFIMELFLRFSSCKAGTANCEEKHDYMITKTWHKSILRDLLLLENQIPMFVLDQLYNAAVGDGVIDKNHSDFHELAREYLGEIHWMPSSKQLVSFSHCCASSVSHNTNNNWKNSRHFTDMIRYFQLPGGLNFACEKQESPPCSSVLKNFACKKQESSPFSSVLKTATQLNEAGVIFEKVQNKCLLDIKFKKEPLSCFLCLNCFPKSPLFNCFKTRFLIPQLKVDHWTECHFRNLIAFEQCHYPDKPYICNYVSLIDSLIHTKDDVELLVEKGVISHELGSHKELATVVNNLCKYVVTNETCYQKTIDQLNDHHRKIWNRSMAALRLVYFRDPWRASSTVVGVAVLVFTIFNFCRIVKVLY